MDLERSHSGLVRRTRNAVRLQGFREFESLPLRQDKAPGSAGGFIFDLVLRLLGWDIDYEKLLQNAYFHS